MCISAWPIEEKTSTRLPIAVSGAISGRFEQLSSWPLYPPGPPPVQAGLRHRCHSR